MFYRKINSEFDKRKETNKIKKRALIVKGLRQIGKTTTVLEYAKQNYKNIIYMNFMTNVSLKGTSKLSLKNKEKCENPTIKIRKNVKYK